MRSLCSASHINPGLWKGERVVRARNWTTKRTGARTDSRSRRSRSSRRRSSRKYRSSISCSSRKRRRSGRFVAPALGSKGPYGARALDYERSFLYLLPKANENRELHELNIRCEPRKHSFAEVSSGGSRKDGRHAAVCGLLAISGRSLRDESDGALGHWEHERVLGSARSSTANAVHHQDRAEDSRRSRSV